MKNSTTGKNKTGQHYSGDTQFPQWENVGTELPHQDPKLPILDAPLRQLSFMPLVDVVQIQRGK